MRILAIETSCDETSISILVAKGGLSAPKFKVINQLIASQIRIHEPFGGVVPNLAKREHIKHLPILLGEIAGIADFSGYLGSSEKKRVFVRADISRSQTTKLKNFLKKIDLISVTVGPGLEPALWTGIEFAKALKEFAKANKLKTELIGVNHMEGHLYSYLLSEKTAKIKVFPAIALLVSGGHTILLLMKDLKTWKKLGETRDDAVGEAFDKVARVLNLPYPGGPQIEKLAKEGNEKAVEFPRPMVNDKNYDFSYSGLKTAVLYYCRDNSGFNPADVAASFQNAATDVLVIKAMRAVEQFKAKSIIMAGGVAASSYLREKLGKEAKKEKVNFLVPGFTYNTDNAAMIGAAGYFNYLRKKKRPLIAKGDMGI